jgi:hypothetical protein
VVRHGDAKGVPLTIMAKYQFSGTRADIALYDQRIKSAFNFARLKLALEFAIGYQMLTFESVIP